MTVSTDAIICFGYEFEPEKLFSEEILEEFLDSEDPMYFFLCKDLVHPKAKYPEESDNSVRANQIREEYSEFWSRRRAIVESSEITIVYHCYADYPMRILAVKESVVSAARGYPKSFNPIQLEEMGQKAISWKQLLLAFIAEHKLDISSEPMFFLASYWD